MGSKRYAFVIADRATGAVRRFTLSVRSAPVLALLSCCPPAGWVLHGRWETRGQIDGLRLQNARLEVENSAYRAAGEQLSHNLVSLQTAIDDLASRTGLNDTLEGTLERLPTSVTAAALPDSIIPAPGPAFERLDDLLATLGDDLQEIGAAWRSARRLRRRRRRCGRPTDGCRVPTDTAPIPSRASATSIPVSTSRPGGVNRVRRGHRQGRLGGTQRRLRQPDPHRSRLRPEHPLRSPVAFAVEPGATVERGDIIGYAGATGRATGHHVHYEVLVDGRTINPARLLSDRGSTSAN